MATDQDPRAPLRSELRKIFADQRTMRAFERMFELVPGEFNTIKELLDALTEEVRLVSGLAVSNSNEALGAVEDIVSKLDFESLKPPHEDTGFDPNEYKTVFVASLSDLPVPSSGVITLLAEYTYFFVSELDLEGNRLVCGSNTTILGYSSENCRIKSTGLTSNALITSEWTLPIRHISLQATTIFDLDATANADQALDWYGVNLENTSDIGTIKNYANFVSSSMAFLSAAGLIFDGTFGTVALSDTLLVGVASATIISIPSTATIERRFRLSYSSIIVPSTGTGIDVSTSASVPVEGYIYDTCNFSGSGTYTAGVLFSDNKSRWTENRGITNSAALTGYYMHGNATATTISATGTPVKVAGTTTEISISQRFTVTTTNRATYAGAIDRDFKATVICSVSSGNGHQIGIYIAKNGTELNESETYVTTNASGRLENGTCHVVTGLSNEDYLEVFVENNTAITDITVEDLNFIIEALN